MFEESFTDILFFFSLFLTELELGTECVVTMEGQQTILQNPTNLEKMDR